uniref:Death domain-containing protein n=1 Tax=Amphimedon queenslandica TaxID=400682 RepID=A0A1X7TWC7_AMPQE
MALRRLLGAFVRRDHEKAVRLLRLQDPEVLYQDEPYLLYHSIRNGWLDVTRDLITSYRFDPHRYYNHESCLYTAAKGNHAAIVGYLIKECGCDPMMGIATGYPGRPVLQYVAREGGLLDVLKCMVININGHIMDEQYRDTIGLTVLHHAVKHIDVVKYLINECNCDTTVTDKEGWTSLHVAADCGTPEVIEFFLSTCNCDPLAKDNEGVTPLQLAKGRQYDRDTVIAIFKKFGNIKVFHPIDSYVNVLLVGNPGAGKSTLSHVINDTATGSIALGSFRNVGGVVPCTAGIIPYKLQHRTLGNIILHDFAGHSEYYSSHSAVIENLLQGSGGVFLIVVNILEKEAVKQLHQWLTVVRNEAQKALNECHVIVIVSHVDEISNPVERRMRKEKIQENINGLYWFNGHGVGSLVEIVDESQCVLVMMSCERGYSDNMVSLRRDVIGEVMSVYKESCPSLEVKELVIDPKELAYPVNIPRERTVYSVKAVFSAVVEQQPFLVTTGTRRTELKKILPDESVSDFINLSLLGGRDIKEMIGMTSEFKTPLTTIKLDIKDLDIVIEQLISDQHLPYSVWHRLGLQLGLYDPRLVDIDKKNRGDPVECFRECMSAWLRGEDKVREKGGPSWSSLATALDTIEEKSIASNIKTKYCILT